MVDHRMKIKENEKRDQYLDLARELKKTMEHEGDGDIKCKWCTWNDPQRLGKEIEGVGNLRTIGDHQNYMIVNIGQNTEKRFGDPRRLAVTQIPVKNRQLTLM